MTQSGGTEIAGVVAQHVEVNKLLLLIIALSPFWVTPGGSPWSQTWNTIYIVRAQRKKQNIYYGLVYYRDATHKTSKTKYKEGYHPERVRSMRGYNTTMIFPDSEKKKNKHSTAMTIHIRETTLGRWYDITLYTYKFRI